MSILPLLCYSLQSHNSWSSEILSSSLHWCMILKKALQSKHQLQMETHDMWMQEWIAVVHQLNTLTRPSPDVLRCWDTVCCWGSFTLIWKKCCQHQHQWKRRGREEERVLSPRVWNLKKAHLHRGGRDPDSDSNYNHGRKGVKWCLWKALTYQKT